jgi:hypothetical protein
MATSVSDLGKALGKPVVGLGERSTADESYDAAMQRIEMLLAQRENKQYNPTLLAIAQGFLAPSATGSFGEGAGAAAGNVLKIQEQEQKQGMENAQMRLQLAQAQKEQDLKTRKQQFGQQLLGGFTSPGVPGAQAAPGAQQGASATAGAPAGAPGQLREITMDDVRKAMAVDDGLGNQILNIYKAQGDRYKIAMNGTVFDTQTSKYVTGLQIPGQTPSLFTIPEIKDKLMMMPWQYEAYQAARERREGKQWISNFMSEEPVPMSQVKKPTEGGAPAGATSLAGGQAGATSISQSDIEAEASRKKAQAEARAKGENERFQNIINSATTAGNRQGMYRALDTIARRPDAAQIMGVFEDKDLSSALLKLVETSGKGLPQINEIRDIFTNLGLDKTLKADQLAAAQLIAQVNLELRKITRTPGEGAFSDLETNMMLAAGLSLKDTPQGFLKKLALLDARADFEKKAAKALLESKMDADTFRISSPAYDTLTNAYHDRLVNIMYPGLNVKAPPAKTPTVEDIKKELAKKQAAQQGKGN